MDLGVRIGILRPRAPAARADSRRSLLGLWQLLAAVLAMAGLLLMLVAVVRQAVTHAHARHADTAARAAANFRCNTMSAREQRNDCRASVAGLLVDTAAARP